MKTLDKILAFVTLVGLIAFSAVNIFHTPATFSEKENRTLAEKPEMTFSSLIDGTYMDEFDTYAADSFIVRDAVVSLKSDSERILGKKGTNGVHFAKGGALIARPDKHDTEIVDQNIEAISMLNEIGLYNVTLAVVPTAFEIEKDTLPAYSYDSRIADAMSYIDESAAEAELTVCDPTAMLEAHSNEYIYYRTDHHQTALGSYYVYAALGEYLDYEPYSLNEFDREILSDDFYGTTWSKASTHFVKADTIEKFTIPEIGDSELDFPLEDLSYDSMYALDHLNTKDKYSVYLDGNHGLSVLKTNAETGKKLAVIKDSYAHSIAPFLANHYDEVHLIDMRYYSEDVIRYLGENEITDVLVLYNAENFQEDANLVKVGEFAQTTDYFEPPAFGFLPTTDRVEDDYFTDAAIFGDSLVAGYSYSATIPAQFVCRASVNTRTVLTETLKQSGKTVMQSLLDLEGVNKYYMMLGINEVSYYPADQYKEDYRHLISLLREKNPDCMIYIMSVLPIEKSVEERKITKAKIDTYNEVLVALAEEEGCYYLNVNGWLAEEDGYLRDGAASDGIHIGSKDHAKWEEYLRTHAVQDRRPKKKTKTVNLYAGGGSINMDALASEMLDGVPFAEAMTKVTDSVAMRMFELEEGEALSGVVYTSSGAVADEFAAFEAATPEEAEKLAEKLRARVELRKQDFDGYKPEEMPKLEDPVIIVDGCLVGMCTSSDNGAAETVFSHY